jgi:hypothetical protein
MNTNDIILQTSAKDSGGKWMIVHEHHLPDQKLNGPANDTKENVLCALT